MLVFTNWRSNPVLFRAAALCGTAPVDKLIWDKEWIGPSGPAQCRSVYEEIFVFAKPQARVLDRAQPAILRHKWMAAHMRETEHPAEKPVPLMQDLVRLYTQPGTLVVDPFLGSGTTALACAAMGRCFLGFDVAEDKFAIGHARLVRRLVTEAEFRKP